MKWGQLGRILDLLRGLQEVAGDLEKRIIVEPRFSSQIWIWSGPKVSFLKLPPWLRPRHRRPLILLPPVHCCHPSLE